MNIHVLLQTPITHFFPSLQKDGLLLKWALTSSILILMVLLLRQVFSKKISARLRYTLWAVVLLRLLIPVQLPFSLPVSPAQLEVPYSINHPTVPIYPTSFPLPSEDVISTSMHYSDNGTEALYTQKTADGQSVSTPVPIWTRYQVMLSTWWVGFLAFALVLLGSNLHFFLKLRRCRQPLALPDVPLRVYLVPDLPSPCLFGLIRPAIYLTPEVAEDETALRHVLAHELTHYAHFDHIWSALRCLTLALHWYNPLVWLAASLSKKDGELACDEGAVRRLGENERLSYGRTLVGLVAQRSRPGDLLSCSTAMTGGKKAIQQRVALLVKKPETKKAALFLAVAAAALAAMFVFAGSSPSAYEQFLTQADAAQSIRIHVPPISSTIYPYAITDADLLDEAKDLLRSAEEVPGSGKAAGEQFKDAWITANRFVLDTGKAYSLCTVDGVCYILLYQESEFSNSQTWPLVAALPEGASDQNLIRLARRQMERNMAADAAGTPAPEASSPNCVTVPSGETADKLNLLFDCYATTGACPQSLTAHDLSLTIGSQEYVLTDDPTPRTVKLWGGEDTPYFQMREEDWATLGGILAPLFPADALERVGFSMNYTISHRDYIHALTTLYLEDADTCELNNGEYFYDWLNGNLHAYVISFDSFPDQPTPCWHARAIDEGGSSYYIQIPDSMLSATFYLAMQSEAAIAHDAILFSPEYEQLMAKLLTLTLDDPDMMDREMDSNDIAALEKWNLWLKDHLAELGLTSDIGGYYTLKASENPLYIPTSMLMRECVLTHPVDPTAFFFTCDSDEFQQVAEVFAAELARHYAALDPRHPLAVHSIQAAEPELGHQVKDAFMAKITLAVDPADVNSPWWATGGGVEQIADGPLAGHFALRGNYRLVQYPDGSWRCTGYEPAGGAWGMRADGLGQGY